MIAFLRRFIPSSAAFLAAVLPLPAWAPAQVTETAPASSADASSQEGAKAADKFTQIDHAFVWRVEKPGLAPSYLFGTMHIPDKRFIKFNPTVKQMFKSVDAVYTEINMNDLEDAAAVVLKQGMLPADQSIYDFIEGQDLKDLESIMLDEYNVSLGLFKQMKPFMIAMLLEQLNLAKIYGGGGKALDSQLYSAGQRAKKEMGGVETIAEQMNAFKVLSDQEAAHALRKQIQHLKADLAIGRNRLKEMAEIYVSGDTEALYKFTQEDFDPNDPIEVKFIDALLYKRNIHMADRVAKKLIDHPKMSYVFAFGAMQFIGPKNVVQKLQAKGFKVTRLTAPPVKKAAPLKAAAGY
jgi:uncharacterized protein